MPVPLLLNPSIRLCPDYVLHAAFVGWVAQSRV